MIIIDFKPEPNSAPERRIGQAPGAIFTHSTYLVNQELA
jgi:hypothetical protein